MRVPSVSVIIPVYNVEAYVERCIESVAAQTCADFEALLVDDGSPDGSGATPSDGDKRGALSALPSPAVTPADDGATHDEA